MIVLRHLQSRIVAFAHDLAMIPPAWLGAYWLRYNLESIPDLFLQRALLLLPLFVVVQAAVFWTFGLYRGLWRFASIPDFVRIAKAVFAGVVVCGAVVFLATRMELVPRSVLPLYAVLLFGALGIPRLVYRWVKDYKLELGDGQRTLIVGSGQGAELLIRDLLRHRGHAYYPIAVVDDSPSRQGREIHAVRVVGTLDQIPELVAKLNVELILIAIPSVTSKEMRRVVELCEQTGVAFRTLPRIEDLITGQVTLRELREVSIEDLLGREPVELDWREVSAVVERGSIIVTGGAGSIGSELCRQIAKLNPRELVVFDNNEFGLYRIEQELKQLVPATKLVIRLGDICDRVAVDDVFKVHRPSVVFHAAAYKHVPMLEGQAREAVKNNVLGTANVAAAAKANNCKTFVFISTDKAVNPSSVMGASKRVGEILCQGFGEQGSTRFITVRFGNVLGSTGSVVPLFRTQIADGGPVTVTHPEVTRFFMTITEACQLILQAAALGGDGTIFVLDMGEPVNVAYLAELMIRLSGKSVGEDIEIVYTGLRPGEKLYEELFHRDEAPSATEHAKILRARHRPTGRRDDVKTILACCEAACASQTSEPLGALLAELVPEFNIDPRFGKIDTVVDLRSRKP
jgi:FlaA1/EpsC-like NDP-sugar epimerase